MPLTIALFDGLGDMLLVLLWIVLPVSAFALLVIVLLHYGKKLRNNRPVDETIYATLASSAPENFCYRTEEGKLVYLDHTGLLKDFRDKLAYSHARYAALQQDFTALRTSMHEPRHLETIQTIHHNPIHMEYNHESEPSQAIAQDEKVNLPVSPETGNDYFKDLLAERDKQIGFLQNQIDLRVKGQHAVTQEKEELKIKLERSEKTSQEITAELSSLKNNLSAQEEEIKRVQSLANESGLELQEAKQALEARQKQIVYLENVLQELRDQHKLLDASLADQADRYAILEERLAAKENKLEIAQEKLASQKQLLQRLYTEVSCFIQEESDIPPVVVLRPDYINSEWEESALSS